MATSRKNIDPWFLAIVLSITAGGYFIFLSASMSLLLRSETQFIAAVVTQTAALLVGLLALYVLSNIHYLFWRRYALYVFLFVIFLSLLVFIPALGITFQGGTRWLLLGPITIQPAELLQIGFVIYCAAWLSGITTKINELLFGLVPMALLLSLMALILLAQRDTDSLGIIAAAGVAMFFVAGARWRDTISIIALGSAGFAALVLTRPYIYDRLVTLFNPSTADSLGGGYQIQQALIAIGSGEWFGRGFGQSIQKFRFLPEAAGDSIFAVAAEELGFIGVTVIISAFLLLVWRGMTIALRAPDVFSRLLVVGIVILFTTKIFINIGGMVGILPVSGTPLLLTSLGGTALVTSLAACGLILNVSRYSRRKTN